METILAVLNDLKKPDEATFDTAQLQKILNKHGLEKKWEALLETHR